MILERAGVTGCGPRSFLCGHAGVYAVCALIEVESATHPQFQRGNNRVAFFLERFKSLVPYALRCAEDEFLYGSAGYEVNPRRVPSPR